MAQQSSPQQQQQQQQQQHQPHNRQQNHQPQRQQQQQLSSSLPRLTLVRDDQTPYLDLVAIHGKLELNPEDPWSIKVPNQSPGPPKYVNWLSDDSMLPRQIPRLRVWDFRYDPNPLRGRDEALAAHLKETTDSLHQALSINILEPSSRRILFVTHGYGGIIALKSLLRPVVRQRTLGLVCLGTPFRPIDEPNAIPWALPIASPDRGLSVIQEEIDVLPNLLYEFRASDPGATNIVPIRCFFESKNIPIGRIVGVSQVHVVPKKAAALNDSYATGFSLSEVDHFEMNVFSSSNDRNFLLLSDVISGLTEFAYPYMLTQAVESDDYEYAKHIIDNHRDDFPSSDSLMGPLKIAVEDGKLKILQMMLDANIRVNASINETKDTALILAIKSTSENKNNIIVALLEKGADIYARNEDLQSPLDLANEKKDQTVLDLFGRSYIVGPSLTRTKTQNLHNPRLLIDDFQSSKNKFTKIADVYDIDGTERIFLRTPSVHDLIYEHGPTHIMDRARSKEIFRGKRKFRWIHLPANNMLWMKDTIKRTFKELIQSNPDREQYFKDRCNLIIDRSHWEDQVIASPLKKLDYIRRMNPRCRTFPYVGHSKDCTKYYDMILCMPYLHYEETSKRKDMYETIQAVLRGRAVGTSAPLDSTQNTADENLIWSYLRARDMPLHVRRTLDQSCYDAVDSDSTPKYGVPKRNADQVIQRFMRDHKEELRNHDPLMLMVDQLWMVLINDDTLITAFPQRWNSSEVLHRNPVREVDIANMLTKELSNRDRKPLLASWDMVILILSHITGALFNSNLHQNDSLRFLAFFERKLQEVSAAEANIFNDLKSQFEILHGSSDVRDRDENLRNLLDELLDITKEVEMMNELKDIHDELYMMSQIGDTQLNVIRTMLDILIDRSLYSDDKDENEDKDAGDKAFQRPKFSLTLHSGVPRILSNIEQRQDKLEHMDDTSRITMKNINNLFELKQRQANVLEAHYSRKISQDASRQATTVMVFTAVTILFLPLQFVETFFSLPITEYPRDVPNQNSVNMTLAYASKRIFGIGIGIAIIILVCGFGANHFNRQSHNKKPIQPYQRTNSGFGNAAFQSSRPSAATSNRTDARSSSRTSKSRLASTSLSASISAGINRLPFTAPNGDAVFSIRRLVQSTTAAKANQMETFSYNSILIPGDDNCVPDQYNSQTSSSSYQPYCPPSPPPASLAAAPSFPIASSPLYAHTPPTFRDTPLHSSPIWRARTRSWHRTPSGGYAVGSGGGIGGGSSGGQGDGGGGGGGGGGGPGFWSGARWRAWRGGWFGGRMGDARDGGHRPLW